MKSDLLKNSPMQKAEALAELSVKARDLRTELKEIEEQMRPFKEDLLKVTQNLDVYTLKTGNYTISRGRRITPVVEDFDKLKENLERENIPYETETVFKNMDVVFKEAVKEGRGLEGLEAKETQYISVRVNK